MELKAKKRKQIFYTFLLVLIGLSTNLFYAIFRNVNEVDDKKNINFLDAINIGKQSIGSFFETVFFLIFGKLILKIKIYKHHFVSLMIMLFNLTILFICFIIRYRIEASRIIFYYLIYDLLFSLSYCFGKKYLNIVYVPPYQLMVNIGIITCFILLIYDIIAYSIFKENNIYFHGIILGFKNNFNFSFIFFFIFDVLIYFITNIGIWLTVYYFSPFHFIISESITEYIYYTYIYFSTDKYPFIDIFLYYYVYVINLFVCLVFNEIIIIKLCNLDYNTNINIKKREKEDIKLALDNIIPTNNDDSIKEMIINE
jgi:hypothetical protein